MECTISVYHVGIPQCVQKTTHTDLYLHADSEYKLAKKRVVPSTPSTVHKPSVTIAYRKKYSTYNKHSIKMGKEIGTFNKPYTSRTTLRQQLKNLLGLPDFHTSTSHPI